MGDTWGVTLRREGETDLEYKTRLQSKAAYAREMLARKIQKERERPDMVEMLELAAVAVSRNIRRIGEKAFKNLTREDDAELVALTKELTTLSARITQIEESRKPARKEKEKAPARAAEDDEAPVQKGFSPGRAIQPANGSVPPHAV